MPPGPVRGTDLVQHLLVLRIDIDPQVILPGKRGWIHIIDEDRDIENVIITLDMRKPDLPGGKGLELFHRLHRIVRPVLADILREIVPQLLIARG